MRDEAVEEADLAARSDHFRGGAGADAVRGAGFALRGDEEVVCGGVEGGVGHEEIESGGEERGRCVRLVNLLVTVKW